MTSTKRIFLSHGSLHRSLTTRAIRGSSMNGRSVNSRIAQRPLAFLKDHWNTWITEADFAAIAADLLAALYFVSLTSGILPWLTHVRLPIGYWAFDVSGGEPFIQEQVTYFGRQSSGLRLTVLRLSLICMVSHLLDFKRALTAVVPTCRSTWKSKWVRPKTSPLSTIFSIHYSPVSIILVRK